MNLGNLQKREKYIKHIISRPKEEISNNMKANITAQQTSQILRLVNYNQFKKNTTYSTTLYRILQKHMTLQNKFQYLVNIEKAINNTNLNNVNSKLRMIDWGLVKSNANDRALYNRVANKAYKKGIPVYLVAGNTEVRTRPQQGPTCWFHAIINGLLMSPMARQVLKVLVKDVKDVRINRDVCPSKHTSRDWFLKYIKHRLQGGASVNNVFRNENVIKSVGLRGTGQKGSIISLRGLKPSFMGGNFSDLIWFYNALFPGQFSYTNTNSTAPLFYAKKFGKFFGRSNPEVPHKLVRHGVNYKLSHAFIMFWVKPVQGHAITGFSTRYGTYRAYDSGINGLIPNYDWTKPAEISKVSEYYKKLGYSTGGIMVWAIYMRAT